jgi:hypothetical protein
MTSLHRRNSSSPILSLGTIAWAGLLALAGCGGDGPMTKGEYCSRMAAPACDRAIECAMTPAAERSECLSSFKDACCGNAGSCSEEVPSKEAEAQLERYISACSAAFDNFSCTSLEAHKIPEACAGTDSDSESDPATPMSPKTLGRIMRPR